MSRDEIIEHAGYLGDSRKIRAYDAALRQVITPDSSVLDLGAGTGILGLLAARAGARIVYSVDSGSIISSTQTIAQANGFGDRIVAVQEMSTRLVLPEQVDVIVCDQIGGLAYDAGVLSYFADARKRLLAPGGVLMPGSFQLLAAPVSSARWNESIGIWSTGPAGFDMTSMFDLAVNTEYRFDLAVDDFLGPAQVWAEIEADSTEPIKGRVSTAVEHPGSLNGIAGMFSARLADGIELTNCPLAPNSFKRWQNFYPLKTPVTVEPGDLVEIDFDLRPASNLITWSVSVTSGSGAQLCGRSRGSSVLGQFLTPHDVAHAAGTTVPRSSNLLAADQYLLDLVDGNRSMATIVDLVWQEHKQAFGSRDDVRGRAEHLLWRHTRPKPTWPS